MMMMMMRQYKTRVKMMPPVSARTVGEKVDLLAPGVRAGFARLCILVRCYCTV